MRSIIHRVTTTFITAAAALAVVTVISPALGSAAECGPGTVYDPPTNSCVAAPPPPPPPPPPAWNGDITPYFSVGICAPIPFVSLCTGI
ncbi:hypothetical protein BVU76_17180 [Mycolicibacterium porcinum]|nr:hypothetical protein BVU76_17180 [Mycolicibacterium porcinum]